MPELLYVPRSVLPIAKISYDHSTMVQIERLVLTLCPGPCRRPSAQDAGLARPLSWGLSVGSFLPHSCWSSPSRTSVWLQTAGQTLYRNPSAWFVCCLPLMKVSLSGDYITPRCRTKNPATAWTRGGFGAVYWAQTRQVTGAELLCLLFDTLFTFLICKSMYFSEKEVKVVITG